MNKFSPAIKKFFIPGWLMTWRPYFIIFILAFLLYGQTLFFNYTYLDDNTLILDKYEVLSNFKNVPTIFSTDAFFSGNKFYYRPLLNLSFMVDAQIGGQKPFIYHLDDIFLHFIAVGLIFLFFKKIKLKTPLAFFLALVFLVHPALTQAVAWLPGRNDSLLTIFGLLTFFVFQRFSRSGSLGAYLGYLALFFLTLLTKETAVLLPILIIIYSWTIGREDKLSNRDRGLIIFGSLAVGFIWFLLRQLALGTDKVGLAAALVSIFNNLPDALIMSGKMILPFNLAVLPVTADSSFWLSLIAWPLIIGALLFSRQKRGAYLWFGATWFLIFFLPPFLISNGAPYFLEHRLYLPLIGFLIILGEIDWLKNLNWERRKTMVGAAVILMFLALITMVHSRPFRNPLVFWRAAVKESPHSPLAQRNLGVMEYFSGDLTKAANNYRAALVLNPNEPMVHNNLGVIYLAEKNSSAAAEEFQRELVINPGYDKALLNLGDIYYAQGDAVQAASYWQAAERANPENPDAATRLNNLEKTLR